MLQRATDLYTTALFRRAPSPAFWNRPDVDPFLPDGVALGVVLSPRVEHNRWIVDCPVEGCPGAQLASPEIDRFFCVYCLNAEYGHQWLTVNWPSETEEIEAVLLKRPNLLTRIWSPGETLEDLIAENAAHGID